jgi:hypothetical protein
MLDTVQGWETSVRDTLFKGLFVQGAHHPRIFGWGHINPASFYNNYEKTEKWENNENIT